MARPRPEFTMDQGFKEVAAERHFWEEDTAQHLITQNDGSEPSLLASWCMYKKGLSNSQFPQQKRGDSLQEYRWGGAGQEQSKGLRRQSTQGPPERQQPAGSRAFPGTPHSTQPPCRSLPKPSLFLLVKQAHFSSCTTCSSRGTMSSGVRGPNRNLVHRDCKAGMILDR